LDCFVKTNFVIIKNKRGRQVSRSTYTDTIKIAIKKNNLKKFVPHQIRHTNLTEVSREHGRDVARAVAGHTTEKMTARYDHSDVYKAISVAKERNRKKAVGATDRADAPSVPALRIFTGE
jgi:integrase